VLIQADVARCGAILGRWGPMWSDRVRCGN